jgi:hypothetical protein
MSTNLRQIHENHDDYDYVIVESIGVITYVFIQVRGRGQWVGWNESHVSDECVAFAGYTVAVHFCCFDQTQQACWFTDTVAVCL